MFRCRDLLADDRGHRGRRHMALLTAHVPFEDFPSSTTDHASRRATSLLPSSTCRPAEAARQVAHALPTSQHRDESPSLPHRAPIGPDTQGLSRHFLRDQPVGPQRLKVPEHPLHRSLLRRLRRIPPRCRPAVATTASGIPATTATSACILVSLAVRAATGQATRDRLPAHITLHDQARRTSRHPPHGQLRCSLRSRGLSLLGVPRPPSTEVLSGRT